MKQQFRARELWLLAPFLLIGAAAFYWGRVEQVSKPNGHEMFVSNVKVEAAPGYYQEKGMSHRVTVIVSHPWPRPKWWNQSYNQRAGIDVFRPEKPSLSSRSSNPENWLETGEALSITRQSKVRPLPHRYGGYFVGDAQFDGVNYVSVNYFDLASIPREWGAITLHGLYRISGTHQVTLAREIRKAGTTVPFTPDRDSKAQMLAIDASSFLPLTSGLGKKPVVEDNCQFQITLRDMRSAQEREAGTTLSIYDIELRDETGKIYKPYLTPGFTQGGRGYSDEQRAQWAPNEQKVAADVSLAPSLATKGRLRLRGKVSLNQRWPLAFEVELPTRVIKPTPYNSANRFPIPLWRDGQPVKPQ